MSDTKIYMPKIGDIVDVHDFMYSGKATVTYIDHPLLFDHNAFPIQCQIAPEDLHLVTPGYADNGVIRTNLKEVNPNIAVIEEHTPVVEEEPEEEEEMNGQLSLL